MDRNVYSFNAAISKGYEPKLYSYQADKIPMGSFQAILDFKVWSKRIIAINCYFTKLHSGEKFIITVYCANKTGKYEIDNSAVDFLTCATARNYLIEIVKNEKQKIRLVKAIII